MSTKRKKRLVQRLEESRRNQVTIALDNHPDRCLRTEANRRGWQLFNVWHSGGRVPEWIRCDGALVSQLPDSEFVENLKRDVDKIVRLGKFPHPFDNRMPAVVPDFNAYGRRAAEHFYDRQFKHVAYIGREPWSDMQPLYEGFRRSAEDLGMTCHLLRFSRDNLQKHYLYEKYQFRQKMFDDWIKNLPMPAGMLAYGDFAASEICFMAAQAGFDVPTDLAVLSIGDAEELCESAHPPVSSFADGRSQRIIAACDILAAWLAGKAPPKNPRMLPPADIHERQSTNVLAVDNPIVARALRFIWDHHADPLTVSEIAEAVGVSRSKLDQLFARHFPRAVKAELSRKRLGKCRDLLTNKNWSIARIATTCGFGSPEYMCEAFNKAFGVSPSKYREKTGHSHNAKNEAT